MNLPATWVIAFQQALIGATTRAAKPTRFEPDLSHYWCTLWLQSCGFRRSCCNIEESLEHTHSPTHFSIIFSNLSVDKNVNVNVFVSYLKNCYPYSTRRRVKSQFCYLPANEWWLCITIFKYFNTLYVLWWSKWEPIINNNPYTVFNVFSQTPGPTTSQHDTRILIASYLWSNGRQTHRWLPHKQLFFSYKTERFHVAAGLNSNRSQNT